MAETDLANSIADNAGGPAEASDETGSVKQHPLRDQIAADRYLREREAQSGGIFPIRRTKIVPPGAS